MGRSYLGRLASVAFLSAVVLPYSSDAFEYLVLVYWVASEPLKGKRYQKVLPNSFEKLAF
jgi:hypothetical protein